MTKTKTPPRKASLRILISRENAMIPRFSFHKMFGRRATHVGRRRPRRLPGCGKVVASEWRIVSGHDSVCAGWGASNDAGSHGGTRLWPEASLIRGDYDDGRRGNNIPVIVVSCVDRDQGDGLCKLAPFFFKNDVGAKIM